MITIRFGDPLFGVDMNDPDSFALKLLNLYPGDALFPPASNTRITVRDSISGNLLFVDGSFFFDPSGNLLPESTVTGILFQSSLTTANQLIFQVDGFPALTIAEFDSLAAEELISRFTGSDVWLTGTSFGDVLLGDVGHDTLDGGAGNDTLLGLDGNDSIFGGDGDDWVHGNQGDDTIRGGLGNDDLRGGQGNDVIYCGQGNDVCYGALGDDVQRGGMGNDTLSGGQGNDTLFGGQNEDLLQGRLGNDFLTGGLGADRFWFNSAGAATADTIADFVSGEDRIELDSTTLLALADSAGGTLAAANFAKGAGVTAQNPGEFVLYDITNGNLYYDADGNGSGAAQLLATLNLQPDLVATDIWIA